ncbi:MAG: N-acetylmuramoyl-L-alanine amidase, partial [Myxococcota bacterium]|nr:N-acetylmuramoyl-L-alanine amidase [Myxococcota bacterium]
PPPKPRQILDELRGQPDAHLMNAPICRLLGALVASLCCLGAGGNPPSGQAGAPDAVRHLEHIRIIALDPGHGGKNKGCLGVDGTYEKTATLDIAMRVQRILTEETDAVAMMTRRDDSFLGLRERTELANDWGADVFLSIHLNADPYGVGKGVEAWFLSPDAADAEAQRLVAAEEAEYGEDDDGAPAESDLVTAVIHDATHRAAQAAGEPLAESVARHLHRVTKATFRGVKQARFGVLKHAKMPAIVVECGFFSHWEEGSRLVEPAYLETVARGIVDGLLDYDRQIGGRRTAMAP